MGNDAGIVEDAGVDAPTDTPPAPLCTPVGDCDPFVPSTCPGAANGCFASSFPTRCGPLASSPRALGATCTFDNDCQRGLACIVTGTSSVCTRICRAGSTDDCSDPDTVCGLPLGESDSCLRSCMEACDLYEQDCPSGEACVRFSPAAGDPAIFACLPAGTTPVGGTCMFANSCVRGAACIGSTCRQLCRDSSDCASGTCQDSATPGVRGCF